MKSTKSLEFEEKYSEKLSLLVSVCFGIYLISICIIDVYKICFSFRRSEMFEI